MDAEAPRTTDEAPRGRGCSGENSCTEDGDTPGFSAGAPMLAFDDAKLLALTTLSGDGMWPRRCWPSALFAAVEATPPTPKPVARRLAACGWRAGLSTASLNRSSDAFAARGPTAWVCTVRRVRLLMVGEGIARPRTGGGNGIPLPRPSTVRACKREGLEDAQPSHETHATRRAAVQGPDQASWVGGRLNPNGNRFLRGRDLKRGCAASAVAVAV